MKDTQKRRQFLHRTALAAAGSVLAGSAVAESHRGGKEPWGRRREFIMTADTEKKCGTCMFWGGQRHVSRDGTEVHISSLGMCSNPASPNYHRTTSPETGPMAAWVKWGALGS